MTTSATWSGTEAKRYIYSQGAKKIPGKNILMTEKQNNNENKQQQQEVHIHEQMG